jgi:hypothetical protein
MENITFFVERYGVIAVFLNFWKGGLPLASYPLLSIAGVLSRRRPPASCTGACGRLMRLGPRR